MHFHVVPHGCQERCGTGTREVPSIVVEDRDGTTEQREGIERLAFVAREEVPVADAVATAAAWVAEATSIVALTGAGISTDSGIPDFRGRNGVWTRNPEAEKASTIEHYLSSTEVRARAWQMRRRSPAWAAEPNAGHLALVELERQGRLDALVTQNTDGLHLLAGSSPERVVEVHGSMRGVMCTGCGERAPMEKALARVDAGEADPPCRTCGGILKATTVLFGEGLDPADIQAAESAARRCDLLVTVGTTLGVYPVAILPTVALRAGARVVIVNGGPTEQDDLADAVIRGSISEILPALVGAPPA
jgi:NAD-dependent deacetylase